MSKRHTQRLKFKTRLAMVAINDRKTIQETAADGAERLIQASLWIGQLLDGSSEFPRRWRNPMPLRQRCNRLGGNQHRWFTTEVVPALPWASGHHHPPPATYPEYAILVLRSP